MVAAKPDQVLIGRAVPELPVRDVERAQRHYADVLHFTVGWLTPEKDVGSVSRGEAIIFFRKKAPPFEPTVHWVFVEELDALNRELESAGANIVDPLARKPWGLTQLTVEDVDGHLIHFHHD